MIKAMGRGKAQEVGGDGASILDYVLNGLKCSGGKKKNGLH